MVFSIGSLTLRQPVSQVNEIRPGTDKAILQLADGSQVELNGNVTSIPGQSVAQIKSESGKLSYLASSQEKSSEIIYNTVSTPRGGKYQLTLADGSSVWLNAMSSLKFPAVFSGSERVVELRGEAYFEIAKNEKISFKIRLPLVQKFSGTGDAFQCDGL